MLDREEEGRQHEMKNGLIERKDDIISLSSFHGGWIRRRRFLIAYIIFSLLTLFRMVLRVEREREEPPPLSAFLDFLVHGHRPRTFGRKVLFWNSGLIIPAKY